MPRWDDERPASRFAMFRMLPTGVQIASVITAGVVLIDLLDRAKDIVLPLIQLLTRRIGSCG